MRHLRLALLPLLLSTGCSMEAPTAPAVVGPVALGTPAIQAIPSGAIVRSVTGTGHFTSAAGFWRTFSYAAREHADGSVSGMFEINLRGVGARAHGRVTCMGVEGNAAWLGGVIEQVVGAFPNPAVGVGTPVRWRVVDNGEGANAPADLVSGFNTMAGASPGAELPHCATRPAFPALSPLEAGNVQVRG
jgi:hypothetical protein